MSSALNAFNGLSKKYGLTPLDRTKIDAKGTGQDKVSDPMRSLLNELGESNKRFAGN